MSTTHTTGIGTLHEPDAKDEATTDPLIGTQRETDSPKEARAAPDAEVHLHTQPTGRAVKSRTIAGWLGIFAGAFGLHRFYLGYRKIGLVQSMTFLAGVLMVVGMVLWRGGSIVAALVTGFGAMAIVPLWGATEGIFILLGVLKQDHEGRPLAA